MPPEILERISLIPQPRFIEAAVNQANRDVELQQYSAMAKSELLKSAPPFYYVENGSEVHFNVADVSKVQAILQNPAVELSKAISRVESKFDKDGPVYSAVNALKPFEELRGLIGDSLENPQQPLGLDKYKQLVEEAVNLSGRLHSATKPSIGTNPDNRYLTPKEAQAITDVVGNLSAEQFSQPEHADRVTPTIGHTALVGAEDLKVAA